MVAPLRRATILDLDAIMVIENASFHADAWSPAAMGRELANPLTYYVVAPLIADDEVPAVPGSLAGYAGLFSLPDGPQADVQTIAVAENTRRQGVGRILISALIAEARARGVVELFLDVRADNLGAQALYESLGFIAIDTRPGYYHSDNMTAIVMVLALEIPAPHRGDPVGGAR